MVRKRDLLELGGQGQGCWSDQPLQGGIQLDGSRGQHRWIRFRSRALRRRCLGQRLLLWIERGGLGQGRPAQASQGRCSSSCQPELKWAGH